MADLTSIALWVLLATIGGLFVFALRRGNVAAAVNAFAAFVLAVLPAILEFALGSTVTAALAIGPVLPLWLAVAGVLHSFGMVGLYESTGWWDHLTHTVSAALVAAVLYAALLVSLPDMIGREPSAGVVVSVTVVLTLGVGIVWELVELIARDIGDRYDIEPVLIHYGWLDTAKDLGFDGLGVLFVVVLDLRVFVPIMEQIPTATRVLLWVTGGTILVSSVVMVIYIGRWA